MIEPKHIATLDCPHCGEPIRYRLAIEVPTVKVRPTIHELEQILAEPDDKYEIEVQPNGEVRAVERASISEQKASNTG